MRAAACLLLLATACAAPKAGQRCSEGDAFCADSGTALACRGGVLTPFPCQGPKGCSVDKARNVSCDQSAGGTVGDFCLPEYAGHAQCTQAKDGYLLCLEGRWKELDCPGASTCLVDASGLSCK